jgi:hypothetical protein
MASCEWAADLTLIGGDVRVAKESSTPLLRSTRCTDARRIEGQVRGVQRMIDEERYYVDILTQISSYIRASAKEAPRWS